jgi:hypothetical protein
VLDTAEFYHAYLREIPVETIALIQHQELNLYIYYLFFSAIAISTPDHRFVAENNPGSPDRTEFRPTFKDFQRLLWAFFDAQLVPEPYKEKTLIGPPLTAPQAQQRLREIVTATTSKDAGLSLQKDEKKGQYQLQKSEETDRYCLRGQRLEEEGAFRGAFSPGKDSVLLKVALALRCGATAEERKNLGNLKRLKDELNDVVQSPSLTVLDTKECEEDWVKHPTTDDLTEYLRRYCRLVNRLKEIAGINEFDGSKKPRSTPISIKILTRSPENVVAYLGRVAGFSEQDTIYSAISRKASGTVSDTSPRTTILVPEYSILDPRAKGLEDVTQPCGDTIIYREKLVPKYICLPLLVVKKNGAPPAPFVSVTYEGDTYWVPSDDKEAGNSFGVFETVHQLLALAKVAKDLPPTSILSVSPIP